MSTSFSHKLLRISGDRITGISAASSSWRTRSRAASPCSSRLPYSMARSRVGCSMTPGSTSVEPMRVMPASTVPRPKACCRYPGVSTPFCNVKTTVSGPTTGCSRAVTSPYAIRLDRKQHEIGMRHTARVRTGLHVGKGEVAVYAPDLEASILQGLQIRAAGHKGHVVSGPRQQAAEVAAQSAGSHYQNAHVWFLFVIPRHTG